MTEEQFNKAESIKKRIEELTKAYELNQGLYFSDTLGNFKTVINEFFDEESKLIDSIRKAIEEDIARLKNDFKRL